MSKDDWRVYYVYNCRHTTPPKNKYVLTFKYSDSLYLGFFINSRVTDFIKSRNHLKPCITSISAGTNPFLEYDSFINCAEIFEYTAGELIQPEGWVCEQTKSNVLEAIKRCPVLKFKWKTFILDKYDSIDNGDEEE